MDKKEEINSFEITKDIVCTIISNSRDKFYINTSEANTIASIYQIIYNKVESLKKTT